MGQTEFKMSELAFKQGLDLTVSLLCWKVCLHHSNGTDIILFHMTKGSTSAVVSWRMTIINIIFGTLTFSRLSLYDTQLFSTQW